MSISDIYASGKHQQNLGHFANIVKIAMADGMVTHGEQKLLDRLTKKLGISPAECDTVVANPEAFPINPPVNYEERIGRLYTLTGMIFADNEVNDEELDIFVKLVVGLGFDSDKADNIAKKAIDLILNEHDIESFTEQVKKENNI